MREILEYKISRVVRGFRARTGATTNTLFASPRSAPGIFLLGSTHLAEPRPFRDRRETDAIEVKLEAGSQSGAVR